MKYGSKWPEYAKQWDKMKSRPGRDREFDNIARKVVAHKDRYQEVERRTGVPWWLVGVLHVRESNADFNTYLGNGERLDRVTRLVPRGRGPFKTFEDGAVDALKIDGLTNVKDWRLEKALYYSELFNGAGYHVRGLPSPYVWGGTNAQRPGKFVADGKFNSRVMDSQPGTAPILAAIAEDDPSVNFVRET